MILALGGIAWNASLAMATRNSCQIARPRPPFGHGAEVQLSPRLWLVGSYHVSQQNTFTGRLTEKMFDVVVKNCIGIANT